MTEHPRCDQPARPVLRKRPITIAAALAFTSFSGTTLAQAPAEGEIIEEVIVTATRRAEGVQDIPINITAVTGAKIEEQGLVDLADLTKTVPGLFVVDQGGRDANLITVRGLNVSSLGGSEGVGNDSGGTVAQYIGDIPLYLDYLLTDIDRVEVLLGPQGTLYGAGSLGGAIRYIPKRPQLDETTLELSGSLYGLAHSDGLGTEGTLIGNLPLSDKAAFRGSLSYVDDPGFIDYNYVVREAGVSDPEPDFSDPDAVSANLRKVADANDYQVLSAKAALLYEFSTAVSANLSYFYQKNEAGGRTVNSADAIGTGLYTSALRFEEPNERENQLLALELDADFGFATLTSATGVSRYEELGQRDQTDLLLDFEYGYEDFPAFAAFTREEAEEERFNQEVRLVSNGTSRLDWIVGLFYNESDFYGTSSEFTPGIPEFFGVDRPDNLEYYSVTDAVFTEQAVFGEVGYQITERWKVTVGGRSFEFEDDQTQGVALPLVDGSPPDQIIPGFQTVKVSDSDSIFKANTGFDFTDDILGYLTVSEGYRTGGSNAIIACEDPLPPEQNVCALPNELIILPDTTLNHEIGLRTEWLDGRLTVNGALYYTEWTDIQIAGATVNGSQPITVNAGEAESRGLELGGSAILTQRLRLDFNYTYNTAELTEDSAGVVNGADAFSGDRLPGSPEHKGGAALSYTQPLRNDLELQADYGFYAQSDVYTRAGLRADGEALGGYLTQNASIGVKKDQAWGARLYAKNLFDTYAETGVRTTSANVRSIEPSADTDNGDGFKLRSYYKSVLEPLQVGVSFTYNFGG